MGRVLTLVIRFVLQRRWRLECNGVDVVVAEDLWFRLLARPLSWEGVSEKIAHEHIWIFLTKWSLHGAKCEAAIFQLLSYFFYHSFCICMFCFGLILNRNCLMSFSFHFLCCWPFSACLFLSSSTLHPLLHLLFFNYHTSGLHLCFLVARHA